jgi:ATP-dependent DNA helicase RecQ
MMREHEDTTAAVPRLPDDTGSSAAAETYLGTFGLTAFRPGQREVIQAVLAGQDSLCIMPTGGGKSLCYQLPAVARAGVALVVSPLIALMKDQVDGLRARGIRADYLNSSLSTAEQGERLSQLAGDGYDLLYVAPERFRSRRFLEVVQSARVQLLAVDEAHCISEWGHDFRHDYARLGEYRRSIGMPQTMALTATATADVRADVLRQLGLRSPQVFVSGFARDNLHYVARTYRARQDKETACLEFLRRTDGAGIVYASTRKACEQVSHRIDQELGRPVAVYHGGLTSDERQRVQDRFMDGQVEIVAATNAFGMGIDKADVRFVVHYTIPGSLEAFYQEAGRAGRDGQPAECLLLYSPRDRYVQEFFIDSAYPPREVLGQIYEYLRRHPRDPVELTQQDLKEQLGLAISAEGVGTCERLLEKGEVLRRLEPHRNMAAVRIDTDVADLATLVPVQAQVQRRVARCLETLVGPRRYELVYFHPRDLTELTGLELPAVTRALRELTRLEAIDYVPPFRGRAVHMLRRDIPFDQLRIDYEELEERRRGSLRKLEAVIRFAQTTRCRQQEILRYFGESTDQPCGHCDNCDTGGSSSVAVPHAAADAGSITESITEFSRVVLSGVARTRGRAGKHVLAAMLRGSRSAKVARARLHQLSTFGLLADFTQSELIGILDALTAAELVACREVERHRPTVHLTGRGAEVMASKRALPADLRVARSLRPKIETWYARRQSPGGPPPTPDRMPPDEPSVAPHRDADVEDRAAVCVPADDIRPDYYWTWKLLADGYSALQCAAIRRLDTRVLCEHLLQALEQGLEVHLQWLLSPEQQQWLRSHVDRRQAFSDSRTMPTDLPPGLSPHLARLFWRYHERSRRPATTGPNEG